MGRSRLKIELTCTVACLACDPVPLSPAADRIEEAAPESVGKCAFLGTVIGGGMTVQDAQTDAMNRAANRGATHIVWVSVVQGRATAMARAYSCPSPTATPDSVDGAATP
jgi:hypothetical protein